MARKKTKVATAPRRKGGKLAGPSFEGWENMDPAAFGKLQRAAVSFYYNECKTADIMINIYKWMEQNGYSKKEVAAAKKAYISPTIACYASIMLDGCPDYNPAYAEYWNALPGTTGDLKPHSDFLHKHLKEAVAKGEKIVEEVKEEEKAKENVYVPTIQDRIRDQSISYLEAVDEWLEGFIEDRDNFDPKGFDLKAHFSKLQPSQAHARKMKSFYETALADYDELERMPTAGQLAKMDEKEADLWAQLKEGYAHLKKADIKKWRTAIDDLNTALDFIIDQAKATRKPRVAKPKSASKLVEKLKFCKADPKYSLASINPDQIIGASELWVFNIKTRKLGKYVAANIDPKGMARNGSGLQVKGTTITGYDENLSIQKTLRKPEEQLKAFKAAGKVALRKFLDDIATTDTKLNGRCNPDTILLKVN